METMGVIGTMVGAEVLRCLIEDMQLVVINVGADVGTSLIGGRLGWTGIMWILCVGFVGLEEGGGLVGICLGPLEDGVDVI